MLSEGHPLIGQRVARQFPGKPTTVGTITKWLPEEGEDGALFRAVHDDGDDEDLDEDEATAAVELYKQIEGQGVEEVTAPATAPPAVADETLRDAAGEYAKDDD